MRIPAAAAALCLFTLSLLLAARADAVNLGPVELSPYIDISGKYDDNVYARDAFRQEDYYLKISPGIVLRHDKGDNLLELEYNADIFRYLDTGGLNNVEDHSLKAAAYFNTEGRLWLKLDDLAMRGHELRSEAFVPAAGLNRYYSNDVSAQLGYRLTKKLGFALLYSNFIIDYNSYDNSYRDRTDNGAGLMLNYRVMPKVDLLVEGIYKRIYHHDDSDPMSPMLNSNEYWALAGVTWDITEKSVGSVRFGYEWKRFDHPETDRFASPVYIVSLDHHFTPKTSVTITGARQAKETDDPNTVYYTTTSGSVRFSFRPVRKLKISPFGSYANNRYSGATRAPDGDRERRIEDVWAAGLDMSYQMNKWIAVSLGYEHSKKSSTLTIFDYTRNVVSLMLSATL